MQEFVLNVPRRKQRGINWREQLKPFALSTEIGLLIKNLIEQNKSQLYKLFNISSLSNFEELPLFPKWDVIKASLNEGDNAETTVKKPEIHYVAATLRTWLKTIVSNLEIPSERTGKSLKVSYPIAQNISYSCSQRGIW